MTGPGWLALGAALLLAGAPAAVPARVARLAGSGRLSIGRARHRRSGNRPRAAGGWTHVSHGATGALCAAGCAATFGVAIAAGVGPLGLAAGGAGWAGWRLSRALAIRRARAGRRGQLRTAVGVLIGELEAGGRPAVALAAAAGAAPPDFGAVFGAAAAASGAAGDAAEVLTGDPDTAPLGYAWRLGEDTGAALSGVLGRVADDLAGRDAQQRAVAVALSGPRSSAVVLAGLPVLGLLLGVAMGARPDRFLIGTPAGRWVCCVGVLLDALGLLWLAAILRKAEQT